MNMKKKIIGLAAVAALGATFCASATLVQGAQDRYHDSMIQLGSMIGGIVNVVGATIQHTDVGVVPTPPTFAAFTFDGVTVTPSAVNYTVGDPIGIMTGAGSGLAVVPTGANVGLAVPNGDGHFAAFALSGSTKLGALVNGVGILCQGFTNTGTGTLVPVTASLHFQSYECYITNEPVSPHGLIGVTAATAQSSNAKILGMMNLAGLKSA